MEFEGLAFSQGRRPEGSLGGHRGWGCHAGVHGRSLREQYQRLEETPGEGCCSAQAFSGGVFLGSCPAWASPGPQFEETEATEGISAQLTQCS